MKITVPQLKELVGNANPQPISLELRTVPKMLKQHKETKVPNPYYGNVYRLQYTQAFLADYTNAVDNRRCQEVDAGKTAVKFKAASLWKGKGIHLTRSIVAHRDTQQQYLVYFPRHDARGKVRNIEACFTDLNGKEIDAKLLFPYFTTHKEGSARQGVNRPVPWRIVALENVQAITMAGTRYEILHDVEEQRVAA